MCRRRRCSLASACVLSRVAASRPSRAATAAASGSRPHATLRAERWKPRGGLGRVSYGSPFLWPLWLPEGRPFRMRGLHIAALPSSPGPFVGKAVSRQRGNGESGCGQQGVTNRGPHKRGCPTMGGTLRGKEGPPVGTMRGYPSRECGGVVFARTREPTSNAPIRGIGPWYDEAPTLTRRIGAVRGAVGQAALPSVSG